MNTLQVMADCLIGLDVLFTPTVVRVVDKDTGSEHLFAVVYLDLDDGQTPQIDKLEPTAVDATVS